VMPAVGSPRFIRFRHLMPLASPLPSCRTIIRCPSLPLRLGAAFSDTPARPGQAGALHPRSHLRRRGRCVRDSPTYGQWVGAELSSLKRTSAVHSDRFRSWFRDAGARLRSHSTNVPTPTLPDHDGGIRWDDPAIGIEWPIPAGSRPSCPRRIAFSPCSPDFDSPFIYDGRPRRRWPERHNPCVSSSPAGPVSSVRPRSAPDRKQRSMRY
jgi:hypothetical protein